MKLKLIDEWGDEETIEVSNKSIFKAYALANLWWTTLTIGIVLIVGSIMVMIR